MRKFENSEFSTKPLNFYNLDMVISVGYRVKSQRGVQFRLWASDIIKEYMRKGFAMDDARLKELGGGGYFKELLARIRDIRASEKVFYRQVLVETQYFDGRKSSSQAFLSPLFSTGLLFFIYLNRRFRSPAVAGSLHAPAKSLATPRTRGS